MDRAILEALNGLADGPVGTVAQFFSSPWVPVVVLGGFAVLLIKRRQFWLCVLVAACFGASDLVSVRLIKPLADRSRPCHVMELKIPDGCGPGRSFPSAHAANAFSVGAVLSVAVPKAVFVMAPVAVFVALSRVVLGVHYPSDILAGALLGIVLGGGAGWAYRRQKKLT